VLRYRDFIPKVHQAPSVGIFGSISYGSSQTFDDAVEAAGIWIRDHRIQVMQLETVVLSGASTSTQGVGLAVPPSGQGAGLVWTQFLRIWYDDDVERLPYR
jgi:hypothetical protein